MNGEAYNLGDTLASGKPVLMIACSYTCPVYRNKIEEINEVIDLYGDELSVLLVYGVEAHPYTDISPYFGFINPSQANLNQGILYAQPTTYGERLAIAQDMFANTDIDEDIVFFDGPCQNWWDFYGPAPNNSYLIDTTGLVYTKHGWFDKYPNSILCDLQQYFGLPETDCIEVLDGSFVLDHLDSIQYGVAGGIYYPSVDLVNNTADDVLIEVRRMAVDVPLDWETSLCVTACLPVEQDFDTVLVSAGTTQYVTVDFNTSEIPGDGRVRMRFRNVYDPNNQFIQAFYTNTSGTSVSEIDVPELTVFPNPCFGDLRIMGLENTLEYELAVTDVHGRLLQNVNVTDSYVGLHLPAGIYWSHTLV